MRDKLGILALPEDHFEGSMPGIAEEAIVKFEAGDSYVPLGAFDGAMGDVAIALGLLADSARFRVARRRRHIGRR